jgi:hypothetical protein
MKVLPQIWIARSWHIRVSHHLKSAIISIRACWSSAERYEARELSALCDNRDEICVAAHQCEEGPEIAPLDLNTRLGGDCRWEELVSIEDLLVGAVGDHHLHTWTELV